MTASSVTDGSSSSGPGGARRRSRLTEEIGRLAELLSQLPVEADRFDAERAGEVHYRAWVQGSLHKFEDTWQEQHPIELVLGKGVTKIVSLISS
ncbi:hypothetical protein EJB05_58051 [Eragrostis curvula]|uniref:Uncharacterized protein n=1 Tax=Eragrostis curvula TaxID=38414 RepID=A0A5J9SEK5_9POAL|nr:hypothetical protein EJB05_58051 [Eragrostis curvula]